MLGSPEATAGKKGGLGFFLGLGGRGDGLGPGWNKAQGNGIDAVPDILVGEPLPGKDVPQMGPAVVADDFAAKTVRIRNSFDRSGDFVVKAGPAAVGVEFV